MLDPHQQAAVDCQDPRILCLAAPGSGKTRTLIERVTRLLRSGVHPREILVLTFTRKAAAELSSRIAAKGLRPPDVSTFHGWCARLLRAYHDVAGLPWNFSVYDDLDIEDLILYAGEELGLTKKWKSAKRLNQEDSVRSRVRMLLQEAGATDYDGLEFFTCKLLQKENLSHKWAHVLVDEGQDTSRIQQDLLTLLRPKNLFVVGDPGQSIYGFRKANLAGFLSWGEDATVLHLPTNYRSGPEIVALASTLAGTMEPPGLSQVAGSSEAAEILEIQDETDFLADIEAHPAGAVLCPTWRPLEVLAEKLAARGVPFTVARPVASIWDSPEMRAIISGLRSASNPHDHLSLRRWLMEVRSVPLEEWARLRSAALASGEAIRSVAETVYGRQAEIDDLYLFSVAIRPVVAALSAHWRRSHLDSRLKTLAACLVALEDWNMSTVQDFLDWYGSRHVQGEEKQEKPAGIVLSSIHAAKGLEWDRVWVLDAGRWPGIDDQERIRLRYVAATRAAKTLITVSSGVDHV